MKPDPEYDCIQGIFYNFYDTSEENSSKSGESNILMFIIKY